MVEPGFRIEDEVKFRRKVGTPKHQLADAWNERVLEGELRKVSKKTADGGVGFLLVLFCVGGKAAMFSSPVN